MRLVTYRVGAEPARVGVVVDSHVVDVGDDFKDMMEVIDGGPGALTRLAELAKSRTPVATLDEVTLEAPLPIPRRNIICVGWNYLAHYEEGIGLRNNQEEPLPERPTFFTKATTTVVGPDAEISYDPDLFSRLDYEAEIAIIIGRAGRDISADEARSYVFGYTLANDLSARDAQRAHGGQWFKGKSYDGTCPIGPWVVTADEIADPQHLELQCWLNGECVQDGNSRQMIFTIERLIEELSRGMTLLPGDIVLTGTPPGVGFSRTPPIFLKPGDEIVVRSAELGELRTFITDRS